MKKNIIFEKGLKIKDYQNMINDRDANLDYHKKVIKKLELQNKFMNNILILIGVLLSIAVFTLILIGL